MDAATFAAWLASPARVPVVLVDATASVAGADAVVRLSSREFATLPTDAPANAPYLPRISGGVSVTESLPLDLTGANTARWPAHLSAAWQTHATTSAPQHPRRQRWLSRPPAPPAHGPATPARPQKWLHP
jgi:hypothetical protein